MNRKKPFEITEELKNKIISAAYKDATWLDRLLVWRLISKNEEAKRIFDLYRATANEIAKLTEEECPGFIVDSAKEKTNATKVNAPGFLNDFYSIVFVRPVVSLAVVIVVISAITFGIIRNKTVEYEFTEAEIINADKQAQQALAIVGNIFEQTRSTLEDDVLGNKVSKPLNKGLGIINNLFEGENNEIN